MWGALGSTTVKEMILGLVGVLVVVGAVFGIRAWRLSRITPEERERRRRAALVGSVSVRYDAKIPANSIVLAEEWSGLRVHGKAEEAKDHRSKVKQ